MCISISIFFLRKNILIFDDSIHAIHLYSSGWHCIIDNNDVTFHFTAGIKQKNIISKNVTGLNGYTAEQLLYAIKYKCHCHLMVDVVNKLPVIKLLFLKSLKMLVLRI